MDIQPLENRILVKPSESQDKTQGGIILSETAREKSQEGKVVAVGDGHITEDGKVIPLQLKVGDHVLYSKNSGTEITSKDGEELLIMKEEDILGILE